MKKNIAGFLLLFVILGTTALAQTQMKEHKGGHTFNVSLPAYMSKTAGINNSAGIQYKSTIKDVYGFIIYDTKEELGYIDMNFTSIDEFYEEFMKDFLVDQEKRTVSKTVSLKKGDINFLESDLTYFDKDAAAEIYYLIGIVETKNAYYKVLSWSLAESKDKFKSDFQKILYSVKD